MEFASKRETGDRLNCFSKQWHAGHKRERERERERERGDIQIRRESQDGIYNINNTEANTYPLLMSFALSLSAFSLSHCEYFF